MSASSIFGLLAGGIFSFFHHVEYFKAVLRMSSLLQSLSNKNSINYLMSPEVSGLGGDGEGRGGPVGAEEGGRARRAPSLPRPRSP